MKKLSALFAALVFVIFYSFVNAGDALSAATTIQTWDSAKAEYTGSTDGTVGATAGGIVWSRHNLSSYGWPFQAVDRDCVIIFGTEYCTSWRFATTEICVFCHTPHFGRTDTAPLWNRGSSASAYVTYGTTIGGTNINSVGGSSLACLSCHDGVTTFDNLINRPGKGSRTDGTGVDQGWKFSMTPVYPGSLEHFDAAPGSCSLCHPQNESNRLNIGLGPNFNYASKTVDLTNDHPINVTYDPTVASLRATGTTISSITINNAQNFGGGAAAYGRSDNLWAVKGFISNTATINDLLRDGGQVQCTSCHDPHYKNQTNNDPGVIRSYNRTGYGPDYNYTVSGQFDKVIDGLFLRRVGGNSNSGICRTCHGK
ncbi:MAG: hypothetical protein HZB54_08865 [Deltaproteobacteria bacterium]|nr:hypothetical protein [Deltaproteobacteria bacterium]